MSDPAEETVWALISFDIVENHDRREHLAQRLREQEWVPLIEGKPGRTSAVWERPFTMKVWLSAEGRTEVVREALRGIIRKDLVASPVVLTTGDQAQTWTP